MPQRSTFARAATIHPKVTGASVGAAIGIGIVALLRALSVHIDPTEASAIPSVLAAFGGWVVPTN